MKALIIALCLVYACVPLHAQGKAWRPPAGHVQVPIWPGRPPDSQPSAGPEFSTKERDDVAGRPWVSVHRVTQPTMTIFRPVGRNAGAAVIVFPGGGYEILAIDLEGTEVCEALAAKGITGILLKYRVPDSGPHYVPKLDREVDARAPTALEDAQRAIGLVRFHAAEWHIDPHKIGVLGFSAGGNLVAAVSTHFDKRSYHSVDAADTVSCRPDFAIALYPGHMLEHTTREFELNPTLPVTHNTPPTFLLQAEDDPVDTVDNSLVYFEALKKADVPAEMHLYAQGGHAFGARRTKLPITHWPELVESWLGTIGIISD